MKLFRLSFLSPLVVICAFYLHAMLTDKTSLYAVFRFYPQVWSGPTTFEGFTPRVLLLGFLVHGLSLVLGAGLFSKVLAHLPVWSARMGAALLLGHICHLGLLRLLTLASSRMELFLIDTIIVCALGVWRLGQIGSLIRPRESLRAVWLHSLAAITLFVLFLVIQFWQCDFNWVGHGTTQYAYLLKEFLASQAGRFPLIASHYDELLLAYLSQGATGLAYDPILPMWISLGVNKVATFFLLLGVFNWFRLPIGLPIVATAFFFFGSFHANPFKYLMLFDSNNPLAYVVSSGRLVGVAALIFLLAVTLRGRALLLSKMGLALLGLGLSATSLSNGLMCLGLWLSAILFASRRPSRAQPQAWYVAVVWGLGIFSSWGYRAKVFLAPGLGLLGGLGIFLWTLIQALKGLPASNFRILGRWSIFVLGLLFGLTLLGNITIPNSVTKALEPFLRDQVGLTIDVKEITGVRIGKQQVFIDARENGEYNPYNKSPSRFWISYGFLFCFAALALWFLRGGGFGWRIYARLSLLFLVSLLPLLLWFVDFVSGGERGWVKTRFLELPVYALLFGCVLCVALGGGRGGRRLLWVLLTSHIVLPILATERLWQWIVNAKFLLALAGL